MPAIESQCDDGYKTIEGRVDENGKKMKEGGQVDNYIARNVAFYTDESGINKKELTKELMNHLSPLQMLGGILFFTPYIFLKL